MTDNKSGRLDVVNDAQRVRAKFERRDLCHLWSVKWGEGWAVNTSMNKKHIQKEDRGIVSY